MTPIAKCIGLAAVTLAACAATGPALPRQSPPVKAADSANRSRGADTVADRRAIFAVLLPHVEGLFKSQSVPPEHLLFLDSAVATIAQPLVARLGLTVVQAPTVVVCPWAQATGVYGYTIRIEVTSLEGDKASGRFYISCETDRSLAGRPQAFAMGCTPTLHREGQKWVFDSSTRRDGQTVIVDTTVRCTIT